MDTNRNEQANKPQKDPKRFVDEVTEKKIDLHLRDINSTISAQDIKNVASDIRSPDITKKEISEDEPLLNETKSEDKDETTDQLPTTWNVLS
jgi:hypothetical protein